MKRDKRKRIAIKGRAVKPDCRDSLIELLNEPTLRRDRLIEYLHKVQDHHGHISADNMTALADLMDLAQTEIYEVATFYHHFDVLKENQTPPSEITLRVCDSISCEMAGSEELISQLTDEVGDKVRIQRVPCVGQCDSAPVAVVGKHCLKNASCQTIKQAVDDKILHPAPITSALSLDDYVNDGGYQLLNACYAGEKNSDQIIDALADSGLRGLGGAGFPVGRKWKIVAGFDAPRLMAVNIDEGEPGTFKDRFFMERDPHRFIEGMLIACWAVGIQSVYIYIRDEYPACLDLLNEAIEEVKSMFSDGLPEIELRRGAGAYICGEESAMIESIEGKRGMPRLRPPFVAEVGLFNRPTLEHNFESLYWVREIVEKGANWFSSQGRHSRTGLRSFSVSGRVNKPGVHIAPAGITLNELIDEYCGGMMDGHKLYGYFPGGASGGMLPATLADVPLDFDTLQPHGSFIGSAAIIVFSDQDSAKDLALNAMRFFAHESCGKCTPCRVGTSKAADLMKVERWDKDKLTDLSDVMIDASICGLGQAAPNPMLSVFNYFNDEVS